MLTEELEKQLRETLERYELIFRATNDVLYEIDLNTGQVIWNDALQTQFGYKKSEKAGNLEWWAAHVHPDDALRLEFELSKLFEKKKDTWQIEYRFKKADGTYMDILERGIMQRDAKGTPLRIIGSFLENSREKQLERAKDEFISLVSHQLRTPLTAIRMYSDMLASGLSGPLSDSQKDQVQRINDASVKLIKLVGEIMDISKMEMKDMSFEPTPVDINTFIRTGLNEVQQLADGKNVIIRFETLPEPDKIIVDTIVLGQILHNLMVNAIRYTEPKKGCIDITLTEEADGYLLSIKDNGIGIAKTAQSKVFERFYRANNRVNIEEEGAGLGLYVVKQMAEAAGYKVWLKSTLGKGATFYVHIPKKK